MIKLISLGITNINKCSYGLFQTLSNFLSVICIMAIASFKDFVNQRIKKSTKDFFQ